MNLIQLSRCCVSLVLLLLFGLSASAQPQPPATTTRRVVNLSALRAISVVEQAPGGRSRPVTPVAGRVRVFPWQYVAARTEGAPARIQVSGFSEAWLLPTVLATADTNGSPYQLEIIVAAENGLMLRGGDGLYSGDVFVGVLNRLDRGASGPLGEPVHILVTGAVDAIEPRDGVRLDHINQPFARASVRARNPADSVVLRARASFDPTAAEITIPVIRPRLAVRLSPDDIQGFGLETADVTVRAEGLAAPDQREVTLRTTAGRLEPGGVVTLNAQGIGTAGLRSVGVREGIVVTAESAGLAPAQSNNVAFVLPVAFFMSALVGGLVGGGLRASRGRGRKKKWIVSLLIGAATGLLVAVAAAVGVNLIGFEMSARAGEAVVFFIAGAAAWFGIEALLQRPATGPS